MSTVNFQDLPEATTVSPSDTVLVYDGVERDRSISVQTLLDATRQLPVASSLESSDETFVVPVGGDPVRVQGRNVLANFLALGSGFPRNEYVNWISYGGAINPNVASYDNDPTAVAYGANVYNSPAWRSSLGSDGAPYFEDRYPPNFDSMGDFERTTYGGYPHARVDSTAYTQRFVYGHGLSFRCIARPGPIYHSDNGYDTTWRGAVGFCSNGYDPLFNAPGPGQSFVMFYHSIYQGTGVLPSDYEWQVLTSTVGGPTVNHGGTGVDYRTGVFHKFEIFGNDDDTEFVFKIDGNVVKTVNTSLPATGSSTGVINACGYRIWGISWTMRLLQAWGRKNVYV